MEESTQSLNKAKNMAAQEIRRIGLGEDVVGLVSEDIEFGLSTEEVFRYAKSGLNIKQMSIYSKCLRKINVGLHCKFTHFGEPIT